MNNTVKVKIISVVVVLSVLLIMSGLISSRPVAVGTPGQLGSPASGYGMYGRASTSVSSIGGTSVRIFATSTSGANCTTGESCGYRGYAAVGNPGPGQCYLEMDRDNAAVLNEGVLLTASSTYEIDQDNLYYGSVRAICTSTTNLALTELR